MKQLRFWREGDRGSPRPGAREAGGADAIADGAAAGRRVKFGGSATASRRTGRKRKTREGAIKALAHLEGRPVSAQARALASSGDRGGSASWADEPGLL